jgi:hypothetical protein
LPPRGSDVSVMLSAAGQPRPVASFGISGFVAD